MKLQPLNEYIFVEFFEEKDKTEAGILMPKTDGAKKEDEPEEGLVAAVSVGYKNSEGKNILLDVKAGDTILFYRFHTRVIKVRGKKYLIIKESNLLSIIK